MGYIDELNKAAKYDALVQEQALKDREDARMMNQLKQSLAFKAAEEERNRLAEYYAKAGAAIGAQATLQKLLERAQPAATQGLAGQYAMGGIRG